MTNRAARLRERIEQREQLRGRAAPVVTQRTPNSITQRLEDGRNVTQVSIGPLHYERDGEVREIDTRFRERSGSEFEDAIEDAPYHAEVRNDGTRRFWPRADVPDEYIEWGRLEEWDRIRWRVVATVRRGRGDSTLTFGSHRRQLRITARPDGLKADLWLDSASDAGQYRFPYTLHGLTRDGSALVSDSDGTVVGYISPITIIDAEGEAHAVEHTITDDAVEVTGDYSELVFPLSIDPSTSIGIAAGADDGTFGAINSGSTYFSPTDNNVELGSVGGRSGWFRFTNLPIPRGGAIINSYILFHWAAGTSRSWDNQFRIRAHSTDDAVAPLDWSHISQMQRTQSTVIWNTAGTGPAIRGEPIETVDCSPVVEEVVTREGWNTGNSILLFIEDSPSGNNRTVASIEHPDNNPAILSIEWEGPPVPDTPPNFTLTTIDHETQEATWSVSDNADYYELQHADNDEFVDATLITPIATLIQQVGDLSSLTTYWGRVRACNVDGCSDWSEPDSATTLQFAQGGAETSMRTVIEGSGVGILTGGAATSLNVATEGVGIKQITLGAATTTSVVVAGAGMKQTAGGIDVGVVVTATGSGHLLVIAEGGAETSATVTALGSGIKIRPDGSVTSLTVATRGTGIATRLGSSESTVVLTAAGRGAGDRNGGTESSVAVSTAGVAHGIHVGGSTTTISIGPDGTGAKTSTGGATATTLVTAIGAGVSGVSGGSEATVLVAVTGTGEKEIVPVPLHAKPGPTATLTRTNGVSGTFGVRNGPTATMQRRRGPGFVQG